MSRMDAIKAMQYHKQPAAYVQAVKELERENAEALKDLAEEKREHMITVAAAQESEKLIASLLAALALIPIHRLCGIVDHGHKYQHSGLASCPIEAQVCAAIEKASK